MDGIANAKTLLGGLNSKIESLKTKSEVMESNEVLGIMSDFANQSDMLNSEFERIDNFFDNSLSQKELNFINKLKLINDSLDESMQKLDSIRLDEALRDINESVEQSGEIRADLKHFFLELKSLIKSTDENTKKKISTNLSAINTLEEEFCEKHKENMDKFLDLQNKNFQLQLDAQSEVFQKQLDLQKEQLNSLINHINNIKKSIFALIFAALFIGLICGAFSFLAFSKYSEYKEIETKFNAISEKLNGVKILKNSSNDIVLSIPKSATINSSGKEHIINLGGGK
ncbi:hypothetical protein BKN38_05210 [Helicobacter sp. CLO-3]|uniref:hypothetical protein n=1 Tax=unclassified Helicobacter TaxID=2593540 RepID=UPI000804E015|nr:MULTISPECIES: hypothetical protein [unclassified Helicobacter]OBV30148.1 hypothetical protein BA723_02595 [Helicobacter sp. CLO-3]OHU83508.1 hypothetical protein BKN38_05210 [Helicobacter sp. CLO-3]